MGRLKKINSTSKGATPLDEDDLTGLLIPTIKTFSELNEAEHLNNIKAFSYYFLNKKHIKNFELNITILFKVHKQMFDEVWKWAGKKRITQKNIGIDAGLIEEELKKLTDDCNYWIKHKTYSPIEISARLHHRLVLIHPFQNGNGRWSRLIGMIIFYKLTNEYLIWQNDIEKDSSTRDKYLIALRKADKKDYKMLIDLHMKIKNKDIFGYK